MDPKHMRFASALVALTLSSCGGASGTPAASSAQSADEHVGPAAILVTEELGHPHIGEEAPDFELSGADGTPLRLSSLRGSIVVLAFVNSWCPLSKAEQPFLARFGEEYAARGVRTVAVVVADTPEGYRKYAERVAMPFPLLIDVNEETALAYEPEHAIPRVRHRNKIVVSSNVVIDATGVIRYFGLANTLHFDAELSLVRAAVDGLLAGGG